MKWIHRLSGGTTHVVDVLIVFGRIAAFPDVRLVRGGKAELVSDGFHNVLTAELVDYLV